MAKPVLPQFEISGQATGSYLSLRLFPSASGIMLIFPLFKIIEAIAGEALFLGSLEPCSHVSFIGAFDPPLPQPFGNQTKHNSQKAYAEEHASRNFKD
jgi:hypothetical protein